MSSALNLRPCSRPFKLHPSNCNSFVGTLAPRRVLFRWIPPRSFPSLSLQSGNASSEPSSVTPSPSLVSSIGSSPTPPQLPHWNFTQRHILMLNVIACAAAISATWLFLCAIPTLLAFKRAAQSLEKLLDVTREELPGTMAAIRLSGMEISDLTMELSDLGQEITQGVRSSTKVVRSAEEKLRRLTNAPPSVLLQEVPHPKPKVEGTALARSARAMKEGIVKGRSMWSTFFTLIRYSRLVVNYFATRPK